MRFGRWEAIRARPNPAPDLPYVTAIWHYAQGMAAVRQERLDAAEQHHAALAKLATDPVIEGMLMWDRYSLALATAIAERTVRAELALARGDEDAAIAALREAVEIEGRIPYDEPQLWHVPVRQSLGMALLEAGRAAEAETVYRDGLQRNPANAWSLKGLVLALEQQKKSGEAARARQEFAQATRHADVQLVASRF